MSARTSCSTEHQRYDVTFKIISIELADNQNIDDLSVSLRFAEKTLTIKPGDEIDDSKSLGGNRNRETFRKSQSEAKDGKRQSEAKDGKRQSEAKDGKRQSEQEKRMSQKIVKQNLDYNSNDGDDENSSISTVIEKVKERQDSTRLSSRRQTAIPGPTIPSPKSRRSTDPALDDELPKRGEVARKSERKSAVDNKSQNQNPTSLQSFFGSVTERFESSPTCMSEKLAKHCIKYEVSRGSNLIAISSQLLTECFAYSIRTENFTGDNITMRVILMTPQNKECGVMDVCMVIKKAEDDN